MNERKSEEMEFCIQLIMQSTVMMVTIILVMDVTQLVKLRKIGNDLLLTLLPPVPALISVETEWWLLHLKDTEMMVIAKMEMDAIVAELLNLNGNELWVIQLFQASVLMCVEMVMVSKGMLQVITAMMGIYKMVMDVILLAELNRSGLVRRQILQQLLNVKSVKLHIVFNVIITIIPNVLLVKKSTNYKRITLVKILPHLQLSKQCQQELKRLLEPVQWRLQELLY